MKYLGCQVSNCPAQLTKSYDKKSRTCAFHRKESEVDIDGTLHRFCQKCSRFEALDKFDGERKNCRERLLEHNRRQRHLRLLRRGSFSPNDEGMEDSANNVGSVCRSAGTDSAFSLEWNGVEEDEEVSSKKNVLQLGDTALPLPFITESDIDDLLRPETVIQTLDETLMDQDSAMEVDGDVSLLDILKNFTTEHDPLWLANTNAFTTNAQQQPYRDSKIEQQHFHHQVEYTPF